MYQNACTLAHVGMLISQPRGGWMRLKRHLKYFDCTCNFLAVKCIMEVLCGQIVIVLNNYSSTTSLYVLTDSVRGLKILA